MGLDLPKRLSAIPTMQKNLTQETNQMTASTIEKAATGIHHVTGVTGDVQANVDFYAGFLGLRLVKQTGGYADPNSCT